MFSFLLFILGLVLVWFAFGFLNLFIHNRNEFKKTGDPKIKYFSRGKRDFWDDYENDYLLFSGPFGTIMEIIRVYVVPPLGALFDSCNRGFGDAN